MGTVVDNLIAYRVLSMLVKPFAETEAFKLGIIDDKGTNLIKSRDLVTTEQKNAYTYLHRLVFNLKKILNKLPGGESKTKNIIAAFFLLKESYNSKSTVINEQRLNDIIQLLDRGVVLAEEQLVVEEFFLVEDVPVNATGPAVSTNEPVTRKQRRFAKFTVNDDLYRKFASGKTKFSKWSNYLNLEDEGQKMIYDFAKKNPNGVIILHNGKESRAIRFNKTGGGSWPIIKRPSKQINNQVV